MYMALSDVVQLIKAGIELADLLYRCYKDFCAKKER
jgi:hypothetical protein